MKTLDRVKSEELFNRIKSLGHKIQHMAGAVQNPDFINEENAYENYIEFEKRYHDAIRELSHINGAVAYLHMEIDEKHHYGMVRSSTETGKRALMNVYDDATANTHQERLKRIDEFFENISIEEYEKIALECGMGKTQDKFDNKIKT